MPIASQRFPGRLLAKTLGLISLFLILCTVIACGHPPQAAQTQPLPPLQFLGQWGHAGTKPGEFQKPQVIACDAAGRVYIVDSGNPARIEKFDETGHPLLVFALAPNQNDWDLAIDAGDAIFVVDRRHGQVQIFSPEGEPFRTLFFRYRRDFHEPASISIEPEGNFYLADFSSGRIARMNPAGRALQSWGKPADAQGRWMPYPIRLAQDGSLYVGNSTEQKVEKISADGQYVTSWDFPFTAIDPSPNSPKTSGLAVSRELVAASDGPKRLLQIWNLQGQPKLSMDFSQHPEWGERAAPTDIAFAPNGDLFVLDGPDSHMLHFKVNIQP